jgi:hypothetical protein
VGTTRWIDEYRAKIRERSRVMVILRAGDGRARKGVEQKDGARYVYLERASIAQPAICNGVSSDDNYNNVWAAAAVVMTAGIIEQRARGVPAVNIVIDMSEHVIDGKGCKTI